MKRLVDILCIILCLSLLSCNSESLDEEVIDANNHPRLLSFSFSSELNYLQITEDIECQITGDSIVECWIPNILSDKLLVPSFSFSGDKVLFDSIEVRSAEDSFDFSKPVKLLVTSQNETAKEYTVYVYSFTGLPIVWIDTNNHEEITSREEYVKGTYRLTENVNTRSYVSSYSMNSIPVQIKGRGNSTWVYDLPKKPYRLKFDEKVSILGEPKDKSWVLLANHADKTLLRNHLGLFLGELSLLEYTPKSHFVELMLNGRYNGTYQICDKIKISKNRVNVGDDGFLIEIDLQSVNESDARIFRTPHLLQPINIKDPDVEYEDERYNYVKDFVNEAESALYSGNFLDPVIGWRKYFDMDSFVDWYLINEIGKNSDAVMKTSCWMHFKRGGKIFMGPLWDFDLAFGNVYDERWDTWDPHGFWINDAPWYEQFFKDPVFVSRVKERIAFFYSNKDVIMKELNSMAHYLRFAVQENNNKWGVLYNYTWINNQIWGKYESEVQSLKEWLNERMDWLNQELVKL